MGETTQAAPACRGAAVESGSAGRIVAGLYPAGCTAVRVREGPVLAGEFAHEPVMVREVVELLLPVPTGLIVDCTVGGGGHAARILDARDDLTLLGIDRDASAVAASQARLAHFG